MQIVRKVRLLWTSSSAWRREAICKWYIPLRGGVGGERPPVATTCQHLLESAVIWRHFDLRLLLAKYVPRRRQHVFHCIPPLCLTTPRLASSRSSYTFISTERSPLDGRRTSRVTRLFRPTWRELETKDGVLVMSMKIRKAGFSIPCVVPFI